MIRLLHCFDKRITPAQELPISHDNASIGLRPIESVTLRGEGGLEAEILDRGAALRSLRVPTRGGRRNVVLGYSDADDYRWDEYFMGVIAGRYANRIANGQFQLGDDTIRLVTGPTNHCLHGGPHGFHRKRWKLVLLDNGSAVECQVRSPDGDQGFPGALDVKVTYRLLQPRTLSIEFTATCDRDTVVNLTNHAYFNLAEDKRIDGHELEIFADAYTPVDSGMIPSGDILDVAGSRFDFRHPVGLSERLADDGLDNNWVLRNAVGELRPAARLASSKAGLSMTVRTTKPGLQVYSAEHLGEPFGRRAGVCLETQFFPDSPNQPSFPSPVLRLGELYRHQTTFEFESV